MIIGALALLALVVPARAGWWAQDEFTFGDRSLQANEFKLVGQSKRGWGVQLGHEMFNDESFDGASHLTMAAVSRFRPRSIKTLRGFFQPEKDGLKAAGAGLHGSWLVNDDEETHTQALLGAAAIRHRAALHPGFGAPDTLADLTQFGVEGTVQQSYFSQFQFSFGGTAFVYDKRLDAVRSVRTFFDSGQAWTFMTLRPLAPLPRWSFNFQFVRRANTGDETMASPNVHFFAGYSRIGFAGTTGNAHSALAGFDFGLWKNTQLDVAYNWFNPKAGSVEHYGSVLLRYTR